MTVTSPAPARSQFGAESDGEMTQMAAHGGPNAWEFAGERDEMTVAHAYTTQDVREAVAAAAASKLASNAGPTTPPHMADGSITQPPNALSGPPGPLDAPFRFESSPPEDGATIAQPSPAFAEMLSEARVRMEASLALGGSAQTAPPVPIDPRDSFGQTQPLPAAGRGSIPPQLPAAGVPLDHARSIADGRVSHPPWTKSPTFAEAGPEQGHVSAHPSGQQAIPGSGAAPRSLSPWNGVAIDRNYFQSGPSLLSDLEESGESARMRGGARIETAAAFEPGAAVGSGPVVDEWRPETGDYATHGTRPGNDVWAPRPPIPPHPGGYPNQPAAPFTAAPYPATGAPPGQLPPHAQPPYGQQAYPQQAYPQQAYSQPPYAQQAYPQAYAAPVMPRKNNRNYVPLIVIVVVLFLLTLLAVLALR